MNVRVQRSLQPLRVRYADPLLRRLQDFWAWWTGILFELLPEQHQRALAQRRQKLFLEADGDKLLLSLGSHAPQREILRVPLNAGETGDQDLPRGVQQTILLIPDDKVLARRLSLPLATEENLREVLGFEMDLHTPFKAVEVYYDFTIVGRNARRQEVTVDLVYSPKVEVDALLNDIAKLDLRADTVTCRRRDNNNLQPVNLLPQELRYTKRFNIRSLNLALTSLLAVLVVTAFTIPLVQKTRAIAAIEAQGQAASIEARNGSELRQNLEKMAEASRFLVEKKATEPMTVQLIDEISRILPDHSWVSRLDLSDAEIQLQGQSSASASLIAIIEASPWFENARFRSPVVQMTGTDRDRFHISADVVKDLPQ